MSKVILQGHIIVLKRELEMINKALAVHRELTAEEKGCLVFEVNQCKKNHCRFNVYEEFIDMNSFDAHQHRVKASEWGKVSINVERHYEIHIEE